MKRSARPVFPMNSLSKYAARFCFLLSALLPLVSNAQPQGPVARLLRQDGKLWVVITVIAIVLTGLLFYLSRLNRRVKRLTRSERHKPGLN
ncbi:CcmD family protein [Dyadobacter soli]|uniref:CcmD family protein n=1 Tax=Dyadobacter soli TaxID=659014 RepID=UPI00286E2996|nr:CcmD family protein [Dyadobacter soli]